MQRFFYAILQTSKSEATILIRLMVGAVFLSEGIQKFLFPAELGSGRFARIGLPMPEFLAAWVGFWEIAAGTLLLLGLLTRIAAIIMIINIMVAIATTKVPMLLNDGFWTMAHESRTDYTMLLGSIFLLLAGGGTWSCDAQLTLSTNNRNQVQGLGRR